MRRRLLLALLLASATAPVTGRTQTRTTPADVPRVLVLPFAALGDEARVNAELLRRNLVNAIDPLDEVDALDAAAAEKALGRPLADARDACAEDDHCMAALGRAVGARYLVRGGLLVAGGSYTLSIQLFDVLAGRTTKGPRSQSVASGEDAVQQMRGAALWLFGSTGELVVEASARGAEVSVDSRRVGKTPLPGPLTVPAGKVNVRVEMAGFEAYSGNHEVRPGQRLVVKAELRPAGRPIAGPAPAEPARPPSEPAASSTPRMKRTWIWGAVAAGVLAAGAALAASGVGAGGAEDRTVTGEPPAPVTTIEW